MKNVTILFVLLFGSLSLFSKDYELLKSENYSVYSGYKILYAIKIDSVVKKDDGVRYYNHPNVTINPNTYCYNISTNSWLGAEVILKDGYWKFSTLPDRYVQIKDEANLNDTWVFAEKIGEYSITAKVSGFETAIINGTVDSIKVISLYVGYLGVQFNENHFIDLKIKISKNYGFYSLFEFYNFPYEYNEIKTLAAINDPKYMPYSEFDVFNFNIGDEFHIGEYAKSSNYSLWDADIILKVLDKKINEGPPFNIEYKFKKIAKIVDLYKPDKIDTTIFINGEVTEKFTIGSRDTLFFGGHIINDGNDGYFYSVPSYFFDDDFNKMAQFNYLFLQKISDSCLKEFSPDGFTRYLYFNGLGGPYYSDNYDVYNYSSRGLRYYKKGTEEWGTPFKEEDLGVSVEGEYNTNFNTIYNPISDELVIASEIPIENYRLMIYDINGKNIYEEFILTERISMSKLFNGIYLFKIISTDGRSINQGKFSIIR